MKRFYFIMAMAAASAKTATFPIYESDIKYLEALKKNQISPQANFIKKAEPPIPDTQYHTFTKVDSALSVRENVYGDTIAGVACTDLETAVRNDCTISFYVQATVVPRSYTVVFKNGLAIDAGPTIGDLMTPVMNFLGFKGGKTRGQLVKYINHNLERYRTQNKTVDNTIDSTFDDAKHTTGGKETRLFGRFHANAANALYRA